MARSGRSWPTPQRVERHLTLHFAQACRLSLLRLRAAVRLLTESDMKITAICESVGWNSHADFYRHLRRFTTLRPGAIRLDRSRAGESWPRLVADQSGQNSDENSASGGAQMVDCIIRARNDFP